jgi:hypothetical protein
VDWRNCFYGYGFANFSGREIDFAADAAGALLRDLIDYAGLFPPASLDMAAAVANYDSYSRSEWNWILGRFIVPVARLGEFEEALPDCPLHRLSAWLH